MSVAWKIKISVRCANDPLAAAIDADQRRAQFSVISLFA
jgi:hypothetical protein